jgi:hypothetical protein
MAATFPGEFTEEDELLNYCNKKLQFRPEWWLSLRNGNLVA